MTSPANMAMDMAILRQVPCGEKLLIPDEMAAALEKSTRQLEIVRQRRAEVDAELARYREQFGELTNQ